MRVRWAYSALAWASLFSALHIYWAVGGSWLLATSAGPELTRTVGACASDYLDRDDLRESTRALYAGLWRLHLAEHWESVAVGDVTPAKVRTWHTGAAKSTGPTALAQAYRLLRSIPASLSPTRSSPPIRADCATPARPRRPARRER